MSTMLLLFFFPPRKALYGTPGGYGQDESFMMWVDRSHEFSGFYSGVVEIRMWCYVTGWLVPDVVRQHNVFIFKGQSPRRLGLWPLKVKPLCPMDTSGANYLYWVTGCLIHRLKFYFYLPYWMKSTWQCLCVLLIKSYLIFYYQIVVITFYHSTWNVVLCTGYLI